MTRFVTPGLVGFGVVSGTGVSPRRGTHLEMLYSSQPCRMDYISLEETFAPGADVYTSGLGGVYPEGLLLGRVLKAYDDASGLYQRADVQPAADIHALRYVFVVIGPDPDADPQAGEGSA